MRNETPRVKGFCAGSGVQGSATGTLASPHSSPPVGLGNANRNAKAGVGSSHGTQVDGKGREDICRPHVGAHPPLAVVCPMDASLHGVYGGGRAG